MKLFARVLSVLLLVLILTLTLASCGNRIPKGEYIRGDKDLEGYYEGYTFDGKNFSFDVYRKYQKDEALCYSGTYEFVKDKENSDKENGITVGTLTLTYLDAEGNEVVAEYSYLREETEDSTTIKIGDMFYTYYENQVK